MTEVPFGEQLETIGRDAFRNCSALTDVVIPESVTSIGDSAFLSCTGINNLVIGSDNLPAVGGYATGNIKSGGTITIREGVSEIAGPICQGSVKHIVLPQTLQIIGANAIATPVSDGIRIPASVETIGNSAFYGCKDTVITFEDNSALTSVGERAFYNCKQLTEFPHAEGLKEIGASAFSNTGLTEVNVPAGVTKLGTGAFANCALDYMEVGGAGLPVLETIGKARVMVIRDGVREIKQSFSYDWGIEQLVLPSTLENVGESQFYYSNIPALYLPASLKSIGTNAFYGYEGQLHMAPGMELETIGDKAFYDCKGLKSLDAGSSLRSVGAQAFYNTGLKYLRLEGPELVYASGALQRMGMGTSSTLSLGGGMNTVLPDTTSYRSYSPGLLIVGEGITVLPDNFMKFYARLSYSP